MDAAKETHFSLTPFRELSGELHDRRVGKVWGSDTYDSEGIKGTMGPINYIMKSIKKPTHKVLRKSPSVDTPGQGNPAPHVPHPHSLSNLANTCAWF